MNKKIVWGVLVLGVFLGLGYLYNQKNEDFKLITDETEMTEFVMTHSQEELDEYYRKVDELKASDIYGGKTPEETLQLYVEALKIGDMELASKYFRLEDQEKELSLYITSNKEDINYFVKILENATVTSYNENFNTYELRGKNNGEDVLMANFVRIEQSGLWKLKSI
jgi:predicted 3-demethylubiquinone-9 3-methyltransferase (glyoxalase superfamily)